MTLEKGVGLKELEIEMLIITHYNNNSIIYHKLNYITNIYIISYITYSNIGERERDILSKILNKHNLNLVALMEALSPTPPLNAYITNITI